jgi:RNA polymerase sigma-70 factor, ECF subfamily
MRTDVRSSNYMNAAAGLISMSSAGLSANQVVKGGLDASEQALVAAAKRGESGAFVALCNRHSDKILRRLYRITKNWEDAEDALQDSFLKAFVHLNKFEERSSFSSWLTRISINSALMLLRKKRARNEIPMELPTDGEHATQQRDIVDPAETPERRYVQCETKERLGMAIPRLRPCFRSVVELHHFHEQSAAQIAETLSISVPAVKSRLLRAKSALRKTLVRPQLIRASSPNQTRTFNNRYDQSASFIPLHAAEVECRVPRA